MWLYVQHINELTMKLDLQTVLRGAESNYLQLACCKVGNILEEDTFIWT